MCSINSKERKGKFPDNEAELQKLPESVVIPQRISAIVFGKRATVMDVNVERVMARIYSVSDPLPIASLYCLSTRLT